MKNARKIKNLILILVVTIGLFPPVDSAAQTSEKDLRATANFESGERLAPSAAIEIMLSRALAADEKFGATIRQTDVSSLFRTSETRFVYDAGILPLPIGTSNLTIYTVAPNGFWKEIARFTLIVEEKKSRGAEPSLQSQETEKSAPSAAADGLKPENSETQKETKSENQTEKPNGESTNTKQKTENSETKDDATKPEETKNEKPSETKTETPIETEKKRKFNFLPAFTLAMKSQPFQSNFPAESRPAERATFNDFTFTGSIKSETKAGNFSSESNFDFAGSSFKPETLQFATLGREAPDVDLSSYLMNFQIGKAKFALGHTSFGNNRHLVSSFSSRGLSVNVPINKRFDITAGFLNGTSVLGVGNFLGLGKIRHQVQGGSVGIEIFPKRQNAMRLEISVFNGYLQALNNVSEGRVVDAERSRGFGVRFLMSDKTERFKLEVGYALSRFFNPQDTTLDPDGNAVPLPAAIRSALYGETSYQILKDVKLTKTKNLNLTVGFRYEYVEPLYKSLGASASADKFTHDYALDGSIGELTFQYGHGRANDNLRNVPSILKSLTRSNKFSLAFPLAAFVGKADKPSPFLPRIGYSIDRTQNFGAGIPINGGFEIDIATIPDLSNTNQTFSSAWQFKKFTFEYTYNRSFADNRQRENENKDQLGWIHGFTVGINPLQILTFNVGFTFDSQRNFELDQVNQTKNLTFGANWQPFKGATLTSNFSQAVAGDTARTNRNRNINYDVQFSYNFGVEKSRFRKFGTQMFVRFADTFARQRDFVNDLNNRTQTRIMTAGMTFNFF